MFCLRRAVWGIRDCSSGAPAPERRMARRTPSGPVARGPVPRDRTTCAKTARRPTPFPVPIEARRGTGPRPTVKGTVLRPVARGPVPRDRSTRAKTARRPRPFPVPIEARRGTGPRPTVKCTVLRPVARGPVPRDRSCARWPGEGQALALLSPILLILSILEILLLSCQSWKS